MMDAQIVILLTDAQRSWWWGAVIGGFVIVLAVAALLTILVVEVRTIERRVRTVKETLKQAKTNTDDTALIGVTAKSVEAVLAEGLEHHLFLGRVLGKVRS
jgi:hypothetical protein